MDCENKDAYTRELSYLTTNYNNKCNKFTNDLNKWLQSNNNHDPNKHDPIHGRREFVLDGYRKVFNEDKNILNKKYNIDD